MDLPPRHYGRGADPAIMLFGKQIKGLLTIKQIKEELSPRGVDERGISIATSSDEEDLNASVEATWEDAHKTLKETQESHKKEDPMEMSPTHSTAQAEQWQRQKNCEGEDPISAEIKMEPHHCSVEDFPMQFLAAKQECLEKPQITTVGECLRGEVEFQKHSLTQRELKLEEDKHAGKPKGGSWSRCPRCNSTDTKFCYFNNYNVNQPRHFCKHCQRYWTAGGTLRNVPVGAGKRKNKHALRKEAIFMSPLRTSNGTEMLDAHRGAPEEVGTAKADSASTHVDLPVEVGSERDSGYPIPEQSAMAGMPGVNTNLELSAHGSTSSPSTSCIQSHLTSFNTLSSHRSHSLTASKQVLPMYMPSGSSPIRPTLAMESPQSGKEGLNGAGVPSRYTACDASSEASQRSPSYPGGCSKFSQNCATLSDAGFSRGGSVGCSHASAYVQSGSSSELSQNPPGKTATNGLDPERLSDERKRCCEANPNRREEACLPGLADLRASPLQHNSSVKGDSSLPLLWAANLWPYYYNMPHLKPILTPQGWAFPLLPPCLEPCSPPPPPLLLDRPQSANTSSTLSTLVPDSTLTLTSSVSPCTTPQATPNFASASNPTMFEDILNRRVLDAANASHGKRLSNTPNSCNYSDCHRGSKCSKSEC